MGGSVSTAAPGSQTKSSSIEKVASAGNGVTSSDVHKIKQDSSQYEATKTQELPSTSLDGDRGAVVPKSLSARVELVGEQKPKPYTGLEAAAMKKLNPTEIAVLKAQFQSIDKDKSGIINQAELIAAMKELGVYKTKEGLELGVKGMFSSMSKDGTARIHEKDYIAMMAMGMNNELSDADIITAFNAFDTDQSGCVSRSELENAFQCLGGDVIASEEISEMMAFFDSDDDGKIDLDEFTAKLKELC